MNLQRIRQEVWQSRYYRRHPIRIARFLGAKLSLARSRVETASLLRGLGVDPESALSDFERWRPEFNDALSAIRKRGGEQGGISLEDGTVLYCLARTLQPRNVVETGIAAGISTMFLSAALIDNGAGQLYSIELPPDQVRDVRQDDGALFDWPDSGVAWAVPRKIREAIADRHAIILQDVRVALPALLNRLPALDLFFHDDLHEAEHMLWEYRLVWKHLQENGVLVSDDVNEAWIQFCHEAGLPKSSMSNIQRLAGARKLASRMNDENRDLRLPSHSK